MIEDIKEPLVAITSPAKLMVEVEDIVWELDCSYLDACAIYAERMKIDLETLAPLIQENANLKELIKKDYEDLNYLPKTARLPF